jgi:hypothetical protein
MATAVIARLTGVIRFCPLWRVVDATTCGSEPKGRH